MKKVLRVTFRILLRIFTVIFTLTAALSSFFLIADAAVVPSARTLPSYEKIDITALLEQDEWSEEDYDALYHQTGLGKSALDGMKGNSERILSFQEALFYDGEVVQKEIAFTTSHDALEDYTAPIVDLQNGDVIVTSSCHTFGWRNGHAALVVNANGGYPILESYSLGSPSGYGTTQWFRQSANFIVLRLKGEYASQEERAQIALTARERLFNVPYSLTVGIFSSKDQGENPSGTNCSHLVWQAFYYYGYDIDADGGAVCTARDIANSEYFEILQVYGFDPDELW